MDKTMYSDTSLLQLLDQPGESGSLFSEDWDGVLSDEGDVALYTVQEFAVYASAQFVVKAISSPFEVATILRQVQFIPSDAYLDRYRGINPLVETSEADDEPILESSDDDMEDSDTPEIHRRYTMGEAYYQPQSGSVLADTSGYILGSQDDETTRPPYQLPPLEGSQLATIVDIISHHDEGISSLWKGQASAWLHDMTHSLMQPNIESTLNGTIAQSDTASQNIISILLARAGSHALSSFLLSPFEIARTRLVVQTANRYHKKYFGTIHCLSTIIAEEGWSSLYFGRSFFPTTVQHFIGPLIQSSTDLVISNITGLSKETNPMLYAFCQIAWKLAELAITLPLQTISRRLQCQITTRVPQDRPFESAVERSPIPYSGVLDCGGRIILEEGGLRNRRRKKRRTMRPSWWNTWGVGGLYRGFAARVTSSMLLMMMNSIAETLEHID